MAKNIEMVGTHDCTPDHLNTRTYTDGEVYEVGTDDMPDWLAENLLNAGWAKATTAKASSPQDAEAAGGSPKEKTQEEKDADAHAKLHDGHSESTRVSTKPPPKENK